MADFKPILLNAILEREEEWITEVFPFGAVRHEGKGKAQDRWSPCEEGEEPGMSPKQLLRAKKDQQEKPRILHRDSSKGYVATAEMALGLETHKTRSRVIDKPIAPEPEAVDEESQARFTLNARERFSAERPTEVIDMQAKVIATKIAKVQRQGAKFGIDLGPAFQQFIREAQAEIVSRRKEAA